MAVIIYGHVFVAAVPDYYVGVYECVCGCVRALGFRHHQDWWVCPAWRLATPEEDDHTHTPAADQASSWDLFSRVAEFSLMLDCCVRLHVSVRAKSKAS